MKPLYDYFYRFPSVPYQVQGRCRVRIFRRTTGVRAVLLTELDSNPGESIAAACDRIATDLVATRALNPKTTRWIVQDPPHDNLPQVFEEIQFTWDEHARASDPQWQPLTDEQVETLTGDTLASLNRRLGEAGVQTEERSEHEPAQTQGAA